MMAMATLRIVLAPFLVALLVGATPFEPLPTDATKPVSTKLAAAIDYRSAGDDLRSLCRVDCGLIGASDLWSACRGDCGFFGDAKEIAATNALFRAAKS